MPIRYKNVVLATPLRLELVIENKLIVDLKAKSEVTPIDCRQLLTYLRLRDCRLGLIINFNVVRLVDGIARIVNGLPANPEFSAALCASASSAFRYTRPTESRAELCPRSTVVIS